MPQQPEQRSQVENDALTILAACLANNPLPDAPPEAPDQTVEEQQGIYRVDSPTARTLHCIGLIREGKIMSYIDLEQVPEPRTPGEKMLYMAFIVKTILEGMMTAIQLSEERRQQSRENHTDDNEGGCRV